MSIDQLIRFGADGPVALRVANVEIGQGIVHLSLGENNRWVYDLQPQLGRTINWSSILTYPAEELAEAIGA